MPLVYQLRYLGLRLTEGDGVREVVRPNPADVCAEVRDSLARLDIRRVYEFLSRVDDDHLSENGTRAGGADANHLAIESQHFDSFNCGRGIESDEEEDLTVSTGGGAAATVGNNTGTGRLLLDPPVFTSTFRFFPGPPFTLSRACMASQLDDMLSVPSGEAEQLLAARPMP
eukprot:scaffold28361_cov129-Isochrysis_galbana.AAC.4